MGAGRGPKYNASGLPDSTAYLALRPIIKKKDRELEKRANRLIRALKNMIELAGFELVERIIIRDKETRRVFK